MTFYAFVKNESIRSFQALTSQTQHGKRLDKTSAENLRAGAIAGAGLDWPDKSARSLDVAFKKHKKRHGAQERRGAALMHHMLVNVSPGWIEAAGDLHDPTNPRNIALFNAAIAWAEITFGNGCVVAARMDLDETGGGVVDIFIAPVLQQSHKSGSSKPVISVNKAREALAVSLGLGKGQHNIASQTSWAKYAQQHLDPQLQRGTPKKITGREGLTPVAFKAQQEAIKDRERQADLARQLQEATNESVDTLRAARDIYDKGKQAEELVIREHERQSESIVALEELLKTAEIFKLQPSKAPIETWQGTVSERVRNLLPKVRVLEPILAIAINVVRRQWKHLLSLQAEVAFQLKTLKDLTETLTQVTDRLSPKDKEVLAKAKSIIIVSEPAGGDPDDPQ